MNASLKHPSLVSLSFIISLTFGDYRLAILDLIMAVNERIHMLTPRYSKLYSTLLGLLTESMYTNICKTSRLTCIDQRKNRWDQCPLQFFKSLWKIAIWISFDISSYFTGRHYLSHAHGGHRSSYSLTLGQLYPDYIIMGEFYIPLRVRHILHNTHNRGMRMADQKAGMW